MPNRSRTGRCRPCSTGWRRIRASIRRSAPPTRCLPASTPPVLEPPVNPPSPPHQPKFRQSTKHRRSPTRRGARTTLSCRARHDRGRHRICRRSRDRCAAPDPEAQPAHWMITEPRTHWIDHRAAASGRVSRTRPTGAEPRTRSRRSTCRPIPRRPSGCRATISRSSAASSPIASPASRRRKVEPEAADCPPAADARGRHQPQCRNAGAQPAAAGDPGVPRPAGAVRQPRSDGSARARKRRESAHSRYRVDLSG